MSEEMIRIWKLIQTRRGRDEAISATELAQTTEMTTRTVRNIVKVLIEEHGCPIASTPHPPAGYFVPLTMPEIIETLESLKGRALSILTRMSRLKRTTLRHTIDQLLLEIREDAA